MKKNRSTKEVTLEILDYLKEFPQDYKIKNAVIKLEELNQILIQINKEQKKSA